MTNIADSNLGVKMSLGSRSCLAPLPGMPNALIEEVDGGLLGMPRSFGSDATCAELFTTVY